MGLKLGPMAQDMREATNTETNTAKVVSSGATAAATSATSFVTTSTDSDGTFGMTAVVTKVNGTRI